MAATDVVRRIIIQGEMRGLNEQTAAVRQLAEAQGQLANAAQTATAVSDRQAATVESVKTKYDRFQRSVDPLIRDLHLLSQKQELANKAVQQGHVSFEVAQRDVEAYARSLGTGRAELQKLAAADAHLQNLEKQAHALLEAVDPLGQATKRLALEQAQANEMFERGFINQTQLNTALDQARQRFGFVERAVGSDGLAGAAKLASHQWTNLGFQINDIASGLAMGQSPFTIMAQQGGQVYQIMSSAQGGVGGALTAIRDRLTTMIGPARILMGGLAAFGGAALIGLQRYSTNIRELRNSMDGLGRGSGNTLSTLVDTTKEVASGFGMSSREATNFVAAMNQTGRIGTDMMKNLAEMAKGFAKTTGQDLPDAIKQLGEAFADPEKGAEALNKQLGFLNDRARQNIANLMAQGRALDAQTALANAMAGSLGQATENTFSFTRAFGQWIDMLERGITRLGHFISQNRTLREEYERANAQRGRDAAGGLTGGAELSGTQMLDQTFASDRENQASEFASEALRRENQLAMMRKRNSEEAQQLGKQATDIILQQVDSVSQLIRLERERAVLQRAIRSEDAQGGMDPSVANAAKEALARVNAELRRMKEDMVFGGTALHDMLRGALFDEGLASLNNYQRGLQEIANEMSELRRQYEGVAGATETIDRVRNLRTSAYRQQAQRGAIDAVMSDETRLRGLQEQLEILGTASGPQAAEALKRVQTQLNLFRTSAQDIVETAKEEARVTTALTDGQRDRIRIENEYARVLRETGDASKAAATAEASRIRTISEINRSAQDRMRNVTDELRLAGRNPRDREIEQIRIHYERERERLREVREPIGSQGNPSHTVLSKIDGSSGNPFHVTVTNMPEGGIGGAAGVGGGLGGLIDRDREGGGLSPQATQAVATATTAAMFTSGGIRSEVERYVRQAAQARGIDPNIAARVVRQESGFNPRAVGDQGRSFGVMQLFTGGGLGNEARRRGIGLGPENWRQQVDFGMDVVRRDGWRQWYGARDVGISRWQGIGTRGGTGGSVTGGQFAGQQSPVLDPRTVQRSTAAMEEYGNSLANATEKQLRASEAAEIAAVDQKRGADVITDATRRVEEMERAVASAGPTWQGGAGDMAYLAEQTRITSELMAAGVPNTAAYANEIAALSERARAAAAAQAELAAAQERAQSAVGLAKDFVGGFVRDMMSGKSAAEALTNALGRLADRLLDMALDAMFSGLFKGFGGGGGGGGGIFAGLFGAREQGGWVNGGGPYRMVDPSVFYGAPRYAKGGLVGGEVPIIAHQGEYVLSKDDVATVMKGAANNNGGGKVAVHVHNAPGMRAETRESKDEQGGTKIDVFIREQAARSAQRGQPLHRTLRTQFGLNEQLVRR